jgi:hypothetical protein
MQGPGRDPPPPYWRAVHALPQARRPNARAEMPHRPRITSPRYQHTMIRTDYEMSRNVGESQSLPWFLSCNRNDPPQQLHQPRPLLQVRVLITAASASRQNLDPLRPPTPAQHAAGDGYRVAVHRGKPPPTNAGTDGKAQESCSGAWLRLIDDDDHGSRRRHTCTTRGLAASRCDALAAAVASQYFPTRTDVS